MDNNIVQLEKTTRNTISDYDIDILLDDSDSMNDIDRKHSRWIEAKKIIKSINKLLTYHNGTSRLSLLPKSSCSTSIALDNNEREHKNTIHFLNQNCVNNLGSNEQINDIFKNKPIGNSSIANKLQIITNFKIPHKRLIILITDGYATDKHHMIDIVNLQQIISNNKNTNDYILLFCLTNAKNIHICFDKWTTYYDNFYYVADYKSEKKLNKQDITHDEYVENAIYNCVNSIPKHNEEGFNCCLIL